MKVKKLNEMDKQLNGLIEKWSRLINQLINYTKGSYWAFKLVSGLGAQKGFGPQGPLSLSCVTTKTKWKLTQKQSQNRPRVSGSKLGLIASLPLTCEVV